MSTMNERALNIIASLGLSPHPEGGYFKEVYRSATMVHSPIAGAQRNSLTDIYFLLLAGQVSRFHRVLHDEIWHFYEGDPLMLVELQPEGMIIREIGLAAGGPPRYKHCIKGGDYQAAYSTRDYSLVGCTVAPGFAFNDFQFLSEDHQLRKNMLEKYPHYGHLL